MKNLLIRYRTWRAERWYRRELRENPGRYRGLLRDEYDVKKFKASMMIEARKKFHLPNWEPKTKGTNRWSH